MNRDFEDVVETAVFLLKKFLRNIKTLETQEYLRIGERTASPHTKTRRREIKKALTTEYSTWIQDGQDKGTILIKP